MKKNRNTPIDKVIIAITGALFLFGGIVFAQSHTGKPKSSGAIQKT